MTVESAGFLNINKALHLTSHDVVAKLRRGLKLKKVGHAGTLDPLATGVLIVCVGSATRLSEYAMASTKTYRARVRLGETTTTYDAEGEITDRRDASQVTRADVERALAVFTGELDQIPPMYSAIKQGGRKLYDLARAGQTVEREPRRVTIEALTLTEVDLPEFTVEVVCSAGTYIRSLAHDIGASLGVGAHLTGLVRTASGGFTLANAVTLETILQASDWTPYLLPPETALAGWRVVQLSPADLDHIAHGRTIPAADATPDELAHAVAPDGRSIAIVRAGDGVWHPYKVFI